jgi:hypothetical protein
MTETEKPFTTITTNWIHRLSKTTVSIGVSSGARGLTTITLPITENVNKTMLRAFSTARMSQYLPLIFLIDKKGTAYNVMPKELWEKQQQEAKPNDTKPTDSNS